MTPRARRGLENSPKEAPKGAPKEAPFGDGLACTLAAWISTAELKPGQRIGYLEELAGKFAVPLSRMRQAVRTLVEAGLLSQRVGAGGGIFVATEEKLALARVLKWALIAGRVQSSVVLEALAEIEALCASLAASRGDAMQLEVLASATRSDSFHDLLGESSGNAVLAWLRGALDRAIEAEPIPGDPDSVVYSHAHIVDAIRARDSEEAARRALLHRMPNRR